MTRHIRLLAVSGILLFLFGIVVVGCQASTKSKKGGCNEYCANYDDECRPGLICQNNRCVGLERGKCKVPQVVRTQCKKACQNINSCNINIAGGCNETCHNTTEKWRDRAVNSFTNCLAQMNCSKLTSGENPPNRANVICHNEIPTPDERKTVCDELENSGKQCAGNLFPNNPEVQVRFSDNIKEECIKMAKRRLRKTWSKVLPCREAGSANNCNQFRSCVDTVFWKDKQPPYTESAAP